MYLIYKFKIKTGVFFPLQKKTHAFCFDKNSAFLICKTAATEMMDITNSSVSQFCFRRN